MTRQAIVACLSLLVASHTPAHGHLDKRPCGRFFSLGNIVMTGLAFNLRKNDMGLVRIKDMVRLSIDTPPGNLFSFFRVLPDFFLFRTFCDRFLVTLQTDAAVRYSREGLCFIVFVTRVAFQTLIDMFFMVKSDRLSDFRSHRKADKEG